MNLDINIYDYISEEEIKEEIREQIKNYIQKICKDDEEIKKVVIKAISDEVKDIQINSILKNLLKEKFNNIITEHYLKDDDFNLRYDAQISDKIRQLFDENYSQFEPILKDKVQKAVDEYTVDNCTISEIAEALLLTDENCKSVLSEILFEKIYNLFKKL